MWLNLIWKYILGEPSTPEPESDNGQPNTCMDTEVSFVKATSFKCDQGPSPEKQELWVTKQVQSGRFVVKDSHFVIGKCLRSVPRLEDGSNSVLMRKYPHLMPRSNGSG